VCSQDSVPSTCQDIILVPRLIQVKEGWSKTLWNVARGWEWWESNGNSFSALSLTGNVMYNFGILSLTAAGVKNKSIKSFCSRYFDLLCHQIFQNKLRSVKKDEVVWTSVVHPSESCLNSIVRGAMLVLELDDVDAVENYLD